MLDYGYTYKGMWPLHQEAAEKHYEAGLSVWRLYDDGTESSVMDLTDLREHAEKGGLFGIEKEEWEKTEKRRGRNMKANQQKDITKKYMVLYSETYQKMYAVDATSTEDAKEKLYENIGTG